MADCPKNPTGSRLSESTGRYSLGIACALSEADHVVSIINPAQIRDFVRTKLGRNKTDGVDASHIREYCELFKPSPWAPPSEAHRRLGELQTIRSGIIAGLTEWKNRKNSGIVDAEARALADAGTIAHFTSQLGAVDKAIAVTIDNDCDLQSKRDLLLSISGVGDWSRSSELPWLTGSRHLGAACARGDPGRGWTLSIGPCSNALDLHHCRSPLAFVALHWRDGMLGAFQMGVWHGAYCLGCCWALFAVLVVAEIMSLTWMLALTLVVFAEKVFPHGHRVSAIIGFTLLALGLMVGGSIFEMTPFELGRLKDSMGWCLQFVPRLDRIDRSGDSSIAGPCSARRAHQTSATR